MVLDETDEPFVVQRIESYECPQNLRVVQRLEARPQPARSSGIVDDAGWIPQVSGSGISLMAEILPVPDVAFDAARILQVLSNLLSNAIKFTPAQGTVVVRLEHVEDDVLCCVSDTGDGIPDDKLEEVFDRFVQLTRNDRRGVGLGLFIPSASSKVTAGECGRKTGSTGEPPSVSPCRSTRLLW
jgi:signal transduction histidine kinase